MRLFTDPKRLFPLLISSVTGVFVLVSLVQPNVAGDALLQVAQITTAVGLIIGLLHVFAVHLRAVRTSAQGWTTSIVVAVSAVTVFLLELAPATIGGTIGADAGAFSADVFRYVFQPLATSVLALLTFFALRASWRALAQRPGEGLVVVLVAVIFLVAGGPWAALLPGLRETLQWIEVYPVLGVTRGLLLGIGIGAVVATVRLLLGFDQPYFDR